TITKNLQGGISLILSNPPFAGREKDPQILRQFKLGKNKDGKTISVSKEILFIEKIIDLLDVHGGRAGLVLPSGIFNNSSLKDTREFIKKNCKIIALIALPQQAFVVSGAHNEGSLLFLEKVAKVPDEYDIFIDWAENVGFDATGREYPKNDLTEILQRFRNPKERNIIKFSQLEDRIDPWYYHPTYFEIEREVEATAYDKKTIADVIEESHELVDTDTDPQDIVRYIEINDVDLLKGKIISWQTKPKKELPSRATYVLREGDILIPNHRHCIRGVAVVTKEEEGIVCTNRFYAVRPRPDLVRHKYLLHILTQREILLLMVRYSTGEINPTLNWWGLERIRIPVPDLPTQDKIIESMKA